MASGQERIAGARHDPTFPVEDFGYVQHLNHFYDIDLIKTSPRILPSFKYSHASPPRLSYGPFKLFLPRKGTHTTFNLKASLKGLYGESQWHRLLSPLRLGRPPSLRRGTNPALPGSRQRLASCPWRTFRLDPEHLGVRPARGTRVHGSSRLVKWLHGKAPHSVSSCSRPFIVVRLHSISSFRASN